MRYALRFGLTKRPAEYESVKVEYEQEYDDEDTPREAGWDDLKTFVYRKLEEELSFNAEKYVRAITEAEKAKPPAKPAPKDAKLPQAAKPEQGKPPEYMYPRVEALEWRAFKEKRPARPDEAAWLFSNTPGAEDLVGKVREMGAIMVRMGGCRFLCKLSGKEEQFINRIPQEEEKE